MSGALPGSRLLRIAQRLLDETTLDRVITPAIALCAARGVAIDRDIVGRSLGRRMLILLPALVALHRRRAGLVLPAIAHRALTVAGLPPPL